MALPNKPKGELLATVDPEIIEHNVDVLIVGGGMAACGTAFEIKKWAPEDLKIMLVDKASLERSGAVAQGLSAINTYCGDNDVAGGKSPAQVLEDFAEFRAILKAHAPAAVLIYLPIKPWFTIYQIVFN